MTARREAVNAGNRVVDEATSPVACGLVASPTTVGLQQVHDAIGQTFLADRDVHAPADAIFLRASSTRNRGRFLTTSDQVGLGRLFGLGHFVHQDLHVAEEAKRWSSAVLPDTGSPRSKNGVKPNNEA